MNGYKKQFHTIIAVLSFFFFPIMPMAAGAIEAPPGQTVFNQTCPAKTELPRLEAAYQQCRLRDKKSCQLFVNIFKKLMPVYDCQRDFDKTPEHNYLVPAIWLAGPKLENYVHLLSQLNLVSAQRLFGSQAFRDILDGALAEEYGPLSYQAQKKFREKN